VSFYKALFYILAKAWIVLEKNTSKVNNTSTLPGCEYKLILYASPTELSASLLLKTIWQ